MKILLNKDLLLNFLSQNFTDKGLQIQVNKILANENSVFLYSKKFFQFIKNELNEEYETEYMALFTKFSDSGINISSITTSTSFEDEFLNIYDKTPGNVIAAITYDEPSTQIMSAIQNIAIISAQSKPNYHWLVTQLAILHPNKVSVNCYDFTNNIDVDSHFTNIFKLPKRIPITNIFDTQCNLVHSKFDYLLQIPTRLYYFTKFKSREKDQYDRRKEIKYKFGTSSKVFLTQPKTEAHGRRVIFENIIITCDNDFWNLEVNASDWCIDVQYSEEDFQKWLSRQSQYTEFR